MAKWVQKFGGTSVANIERIEAVADRLAKSHGAGHQLVVVVSAMSGETNRLIELAKSISPEPEPSELDALLATGEQTTASLLAMALLKRGVKSRSFTASQVGLETDSSFNKARIKNIDAKALNHCLAEGGIAVVAGFQGVDDAARITTLGRGGSDTTAVALAVAVKADECHIFTDVDGVYTTDPRIEPKARKLDTVTFEEMLEMASLGSKVLQIRAVEFAGKYKMPLRVLSSFTQGQNLGTLITLEQGDTMEAAVVSGIACQKDEAKISILGLPDKPGVAYQVLGAVADGNIDVDVIVQNIAADGLNDLTFTVPQGDCKNALAIVQKVADSLGAKAVQSDQAICKVSIIGVGMRSHVGVAAKMFKALADANINIQLITTSEIKISVILAEDVMQQAVNVLHECFALASDAKHA